MSEQEQSETDQQFLADALEGLRKSPKSISSKYFYDHRGSSLFDQICDLDEYYLTRTETEILEQSLPEIANTIGGNARLVEFGSGSSTKTTRLLDALEQPAIYVPVDISEDHLLQTAEKLQYQYPEVRIEPLVADFTEEVHLPEVGVEASKTVAFFPGSTIGNFEVEEAVDLLSGIADTVGEDGQLLIGIDLEKDDSVIVDAYNDSKGVTAQFNLNVLERMNRELDANFDVERFEHDAVYNREDGRIEMYLVSTEEQTVGLGGEELEFCENEKVLTEYSHKYSIERFSILAARAGFDIENVWTDDNQYFAVVLLSRIS